MTGWTVRRRAGSVNELHELVPAATTGCEMWAMEPSGPALVLGSGQAATSGAAVLGGSAVPPVVVRRSGGGAVLVEPASSVWIDVILPAGDPRWVDDVSRSMVWLGRIWVEALDSLGISARVHDGPMVERELGGIACFAGIAAGEVVVDRDGAMAKLVGISQRRTRHWARFQCTVHRRFDADAVATVLAPLVPADRRVELREVLQRRVATIGSGWDDVVDAFARALHAAG